MDFGLVVAAGQGRRFGKEKQYELLASRPVLLYPLEAFERSQVLGVALVVPGPRRLETEEILKIYGLSKVHWIVGGGPKRMDSVWAGLKELPEEGRVAIHDGVRPFITPRLIDQGFKYLNRHRAVVYGRKIRETIKEVVGGRVVRTIERERLYSIQTPQFFEIGLIRRAYEVARGDRFEGPDDASLVERIGEEVRVILGPIVNFKITSPEDLNLAKLLIRGQR